MIFQLIYSFTWTVLCFLIFWWSSIPFTSTEDQVWTFAVCGLIIGLILGTIIFLNSKINRIKPTWLIASYSLYTIYIFGFFMGLPVFNLILAPIAGAYMKKRLANSKISKEGKSDTIKETVLFSNAIMVIVCIASAVIALSDQSTAANLKGMLNLNFDVTTWMIWVLIIVGGSLLLYLNNLLIKKTIGILKK